MRSIAMSDQNPPVDHMVVDDDGDAERSTSAIQSNLKEKSTWIRLVFMLVLFFLGWVASMVAGVVVVLGFFWVLFTGEANKQLKGAGHGIATSICQIIQYLTYNTEERPFPFDASWPVADTD